MHCVMPYCCEHRSATQTRIDPATPPSDLLAGSQAIRAAQDTCVQRGAPDGVRGGAHGRAVRGTLHGGREWDTTSEVCETTSRNFEGK